MTEVNLIEKAVKALKSGELYALPTETVYGLAGLALQEPALQKIFSVKGRPLIDPLIIHIFNFDQLQQLTEANEDRINFLENFWPGPLTVILPKKPIIPDLATAGLPTVAIRMPSHPLFRTVLEKTGEPLAAPSANPFGYLSPTTAEHVQEQLGEKIAGVLDGGPCKIGLESTILDLSKPNDYKILRPGPISKEEIEVKLGKSVTFAEKPKDEDGPLIAPGLMSKHYSPHTPLSLIKAGEDPYSSDEQSAIIRLQRPKNEKNNEFWLSENGDLQEVAKNLFSLLRALDKKSFNVIYIEIPPNEGIGVAINNRLSRAASKS